MPSFQRGDFPLRAIKGLLNGQRRDRGFNLTEVFEAQRPIAIPCA